MNKLIVDALDLLFTSEKGLAEVVDNLLREADITGKEADDLRVEALDTLRGLRSRTVDRAGSVLDRLAAEIFKRTHVPSRDDLARLTHAVEDLRLEVARLRDRVDETAQPAPARAKRPARKGDRPRSEA